MNNRHRRVARLKAQEQKRFIKQLSAGYEAMNKVMTGITESFAVFWNSLVKIVNHIAQDVEEALRK